jgi:DNA-directed RNA polymerase specialized sigma24 family protein
MCYSVSKLKKTQKGEGMAKETLKAQVERLTAENVDLKNKLDEAYAEAIRLNSELSRKHDVSDAPAYQGLLRDNEQWKRVAANRKEQIDKADKRYSELIGMYEELQKQLDASVTAYNALKSDFDALAIQSKAKAGERARNERGAGRKAILSNEMQEEVIDMHRLGMSYRAIANKLDVSFSTVARICQRMSSD